MHLRPISLSILLTIVFLATNATPVHASPQGDKLHKQALAAAQEGSLSEAKMLWTKAYRLDRKPKYLLNLGRIAEESDKPLDALGYYERYLKKVPDRSQYTRLRAMAHRKVRALLQRVATLEIVAHQPGVVVFVDQRAIGKGPLRFSTRLTQGKHLVVATLRGHHGQTHKLELYGGQKRQLVLLLSKICPKIIKQKAQMRYPMPRWLPWTILGTGLAAAVAGIAPLVLQDKAYQDYNDSIVDLLPLGLKQAHKNSLSGN